MEMNIFIPQSMITQYELSEIADAKLQIITPKSSDPIIGLVQDSILGVYKLSLSKEIIKWQDVMNISMYIENKDKYNKKENLETRDIFSLLLNKNMNINENINIKDGILKSDKIGKSGLNNTLISYIWEKYGPQETKYFIDNVQKLILNWLIQEGFSVGYGDTLINEDIHNEVKKKIEEKKIEIANMITELENNPELNEPEALENVLKNNLNEVGMNVGRIIMDKINNDNNFKIMIESESKGSIVNLSQIIGCLGQNNLKFKRIEKKVNNRSLPHFHYNDDKAEARGFISSSYREGLTPTEFFFHHMTGREGLIDTAIKTSDTGYLQRKLIKSMEDIMICYDGTVRNAVNNIIQYTYSNSNYDQTKQKKVRMNLILMNNEEVESKYVFNKDEIKLFDKKEYDQIEKLNIKIRNKIYKFRKLIRDLYYRVKINQKVIENIVYQPVNYKRNIEDIINNKQLNKSKEYLSPLYVYEKIKYILRPDITRLFYMSKKDIENKILKVKDDKINKTLFKILLYEYISPKRCILEYKFNKLQFDELVNIIIKSYNETIVEPGEMVGILTGQSMGETLTQLTLNSVDWNEEIYYKKDNYIIVDKIGNIIDNELNNNKDKILHYENETEYLDIKDKNLYTPSVDENGNMSWKKIEALTRHLPGGKLVYIKTKSGRSVKATRGHSLLVYENNKIIPKLGSDIQIGDKLPIMYKYPKTENIEEYNGVILNNENGYKMGYCKFIDINILLSSVEFIKGFISGFLDKKYNEKELIINNNEIIIKNVYNEYQDKKNIFTITYNNYVQILAEIFNKINIFVSFSYRDIIIDSYNFNNLLKYINIKDDKLLYDILKLYIINENENNIINSNYDINLLQDIILDEVILVEEVESSKDKVYDLTIEDTRNFMILGGLNVRDTFHSTGSGVKEMQGVPRFREILNCSKNIKNPYMIIYLKDKYKENKEIAEKLSRNIVKLNMINILDMGEIIYDPIINEDNYFNKDKINKENIFYLNGENENIESLSWLFRFKLNNDKIVKYDISLLDIKSEFIKFWEAGEFMTKKKRKENTKINNIGICSTFENVENIYIHIRYDIYNIDIDYLYEIYDIIINKFSIRGITGILSTEDVKEEKYIAYDDIGNKIEKSEYVIYTTGINLTELKNIKVIDFKRTSCNDTVQIYKNYGIDNANRSIIREIEQVYAGQKINNNHLVLLADIMTNSPNITSIDRHGIGRMDIEPLGKATFEKTFDSFVNAAIYNETDHLKNVSSRIMVGKSFLGGTGLCEIISDINMIINSSKGTVLSQDLKTNYIKESLLLQDIEDRNIDDIFVP